MKTNNETNSCAFFVSNEQVESVEFIDRKNSPYGYTKFYWFFVKFGGTSSIVNK